MSANPQSSNLLMPARDPGAFAALARRRSVLARNLCEPGPDRLQVERMLELAMRVPDHGKIAPWRFLLFEDEARAAFGEVLVNRVQELNADVGDTVIVAERGRFLRAPLVIAVIASPDLERRIPEWEQCMSAGAVCMNLLHAATLCGFGAQWLTEWYAYDTAVQAALGLCAHEKVAGFIYIGTAAEAPDERPRPALADRVERFAA